MSSYGTEFPSWVSKCNLLSSYPEVCNTAFNINFYATLVAMVVFGLIILIDHKRINRILCGAAPGVLFFMIHSMINTFFWISRLAVSASETSNIPNAISMHFLDYVEVFDIGIFCLQIFLFVGLLHTIMNNMYKNSDVVILFTSVFSSVLFYSNTSQFFSLLVPPSQNFEARVMGLIWMPVIIMGMRIVSYVITVVCDFFDLLSFSFNATYGYDRMDEIVIVQHRNKL